MDGASTCTSSNSFFVAEGDAAVRFHGCRLILPCVSVGNVGQLAVDLIVATLRMQRVGWISDPAVLPVVGNDAFDHTPGRGFMHTAAEVFWREDLKTVVVQLRTPIAKGCSKGFCQRLLHWVKEEQLKEVVVLTSSHAHERRDTQIRGPPYRFILNSDAANLLELFTKELDWLPLELRKEGTISQQNGELSSSSSLPTPSELFLPGSGFALLLLNESSVMGVGMVILVEFCSQGDNVSDAIGLASCLNSWLNLVQVKHGRPVWRSLNSWELMFGSPHPQELY